MNIDRLPAGYKGVDRGIVDQDNIDIAFAQADAAVAKALLGGLAAAAVASLLAWLAARRLSEDLDALARAAFGGVLTLEVFSVDDLISSRELVLAWANGAL